jgi:hypothetical protein
LRRTVPNIERRTARVEERGFSPVPPGRAGVVLGGVIQPSNETLEQKKGYYAFLDFAISDTRSPPP